MYAVIFYCNLEIKSAENPGQWYIVDQYKLMEIWNSLPDDFILHVWYLLSLFNAVCVLSNP